MNISIFLQIAGIFFVMIGAILALSKLWKSYFERSNKMVNLLSSTVEKVNEQNNKKSGEKKIQNAEDFFCYFIKEEMSTYKGQMKIRKLILQLSSVEERFLVGGVGLIVFGSVLQIIGLIIS